MSAAPAKTPDPSMEEILASIRRIIADDGEVAKDRPDDAHPGDPDDVLDLAEAANARIIPASQLDRDGEAGELSFVEVHAPEPARAMSATTPPRPEPVRAAEPLRASAEPLPPHSPPALVQDGASLGSATASPNASSGGGAAAVGPDQLVSTATTASVSHAFNILSHTILTQNARTLEDLVRDMLKPMLKVWLDDNLPPLVERLVRAEIERVARGSR